MLYLTEMRGIKDTVILTLNDCEVEGTDGPCASYVRRDNNLVALDRS